MKKIILVISLFFSGILFADVPPSQVTEVSHLLAFVKNSKCIITRNGEQHAGEKAVDHIQNKYDYYRDDIKNTEDFIKYSATKSMLSGKYYTVSCAGKKTVKTKDWLLDELKKHRQLNSSKVDKAEITHCTEPRPKICTMQYMPVCAMLKDGSKKTYASDCSACSDSNVMSYRTDGC